jgi:hypothetical protein
MRLTDASKTRRIERPDGHADWSEVRAEDGLLSHPGYPPAMMVRILAAWPLMLFSRPVGALP